MKKTIRHSGVQILLVILFVFALAISSCKQPIKTDKEEESQEQGMHPQWSKDAVIYEANVRQFTPEGTFKAFTEHLPRLKDMGVDIIWLMPVHPIGEKNRKGTLGSYYSVRDYTDVNPNLELKKI